METVHACRGLRSVAHETNLQDVTIDWDTVDQASLRLFRNARSATSLQSMIDARNC
jgi:hypothetical protein